MTIPHSPELEQRVLGALLLDAAACWDRIGDRVSVADFFEQRHAMVFEAIAGLVNACKPVDIITVHEVLKAKGFEDRVGGLLYLNQLNQCTSTIRPAGEWADRLAEIGAQRRVLSAAHDAVSLAEGQGDSAGMSAAERADAAAAKFLALMQSRQRSEPRQMPDLAVAWIDQLQEIALGHAQPGVPTGLSALDEELNGGFRPGHLYILAARPSVGKSSLAQSVMTHAALNEGEPGLYLNLEMPGSEMVGRAVANLGRVDYRALQRGQLDDDDWSCVSEGVEKLRQIPLLIDDEPGLTLGAIRAKAMAVKRRHGLRLLALDYLQLCASTGRHQNRNGEVEEISRGLKSLAKELGISVIALSQLNREVEKRSSPEPTLADLRDSGAIEQDADVVMFLWRCRAFSESQVMGLTLAKNRQGRLARLALEFRGNYQRWSTSEADVTPPSRGGRFGAGKGAE